MSITANNLQSFRPYHPGELVKEELECRCIKQIDFAKKFGMQTDYNIQVARKNNSLLEKLNNIKR